MIQRQNHKTQVCKLEDMRQTKVFDKSVTNVLFTSSLSKSFATFQSLQENGILYKENLDQDPDLQKKQTPKQNPQVPAQK